jgi:hypothetical protein
MSIKNSNDTIGNRSRDLPVCSTVPQSLRHHMFVHVLKTNQEANSSMHTSKEVKSLLVAV